MANEDFNSPFLVWCLKTFGDQIRSVTHEAKIGDKSIVVIVDVSGPTAHLAGDLQSRPAKSPFGSGDQDDPLTDLRVVRTHG